MTATASVERNRSLALLRREPRLLRLLVGAAISGAGDWCYGVVLVVWITGRTDASPAWIAVATVGRLLPYALAAPIGGAIADRFDGRRVLVVSSLARAVLLLGLAATVANHGSLAIGLLLVIFAEGVGAAHRPTVLSVIPALVGEREAATANSTFGGLMQLSLLAGPAVAAVGLAVTTPGRLLVVVAAAFLLSAALVPPLVRTQTDAANPHGSLLGSLAEGARGLAQSPGAPAILGLVAVSEFVFGAEGVAQVLIAADRLGRPASVGILVAAVGLGGLIAAPFVPRLAERPRLVVPFVLANLLGAIPLMLLSLPRTVPGAVAILLVEGCGVIAYEVLLITLLQRIVPRALLGRVFGLQEGLVIGSQVIGAMCAPVIIGVVGLRMGVVVIGGLLAVACLLLWRPMSRADAVAESAARRWAPYVTVLRRLAILDGVPQALLEQVAESIVERSVRAGDVLIREGDVADLLYVVRDGSYEAVAATEDGGERALSRMGPDAWFGEIGLLGRRRRTATVRALTDGTVWTIPGPVFLEAVEGGPAIADPLQRTMLRRLANHGGEAA